MLLFEIRLRLILFVQPNDVMNRISTCTLVFSLFFYVGFSQTNLTRESQLTTFSARVINPVTVEVEKLDKSLNFVAQNNSWYPYTLELEFTTLSNLTPSMNKYRIVVNPGRSNLFRLTIVDDKSPHNYGYSTRYSIGDNHKKPDFSFTYLVPLKKGKSISMGGDFIAVDTMSFRRGFPVLKGDTIVCMRKGMVTTVPEMNQRYDHIQPSSIEIMHSDGTVASYALVEGEQVLVKPGQQVYPLQPLAIIQTPRNFFSYVYEFAENNRIHSFNYKLEPEKIEESNQHNFVVDHQVIIVETELTGREKKRFSKGELF